MIVDPPAAIVDIHASSSTNRAKKEPDLDGGKAGPGGKRFASIRCAVKLCLPRYLNLYHAQFRIACYRHVLRKTSGFLAVR